MALPLYLTLPATTLCIRKQWQPTRHNWLLPPRHTSPPHRRDSLHRCRRRTRRSCILICSLAELLHQGAELGRVLPLADFALPRSGYEQAVAEGLVALVAARLLVVAVVVGEAAVVYLICRGQWNQ